MLLVITIAIIISGLGITEFRAIETVTFGLLSKPLAFKIHLNLWIPFLILLIMHVFLKRTLRFIKSRERDGI